VPLALVQLLPALGARHADLGGAAALGPSNATRRSPNARPCQHLETLASYEDYTAQNPFAVVGFVKPGLLRLVTIRGVMLPETMRSGTCTTAGAWPG